MQQIPFGGLAPPGPAGDFTSLPRQVPSWIKGRLLLREGVWEERGWKRRRGEKKGKGRVECPLCLCPL